MKLFSLLFFAVVISTGLLLIQPASSQEYINTTEISVTPAIIDSPVEPGGSVQRSLQITNGSQSSLPISILAQSAVIDGEPLDDRSIVRYDVSNWISFAEETYLFEPGQTRSVPFTITAPFTAQPGGHYAQLSIRSLALQSSDNNNRGLVFPEIGVPILMTVPGEIIEDARVSNIDIFPSFTTNTDNVLLEIPIENSGTVHNLVSGRVVLEQNGKIVYAESFQPGIVLPSTRKRLLHDWTTPGFGRYSSYVELNFGTKSQDAISSRETVYVVPPIWSLFWLALFVWAGLYTWPRRNNLKSAIRVVFD